MRVKAHHIRAKEYPGKTGQPTQNISGRQLLTNLQNLPPVHLIKTEKPAQHQFIASIYCSPVFETDCLYLCKIH